MPGEAIGDGIADLLGIEPGMVVQTRNWGLGTACLDGVRAVPEAGHGGQLASDELAEAVPAAGLVRTGGHSLGDGWRAIRLTWPPWRRTWR